MALSKTVTTDKKDEATFNYLDAFATVSDTNEPELTKKESLQKPVVKDSRNGKNFKR